jgi:amidase
MTTRVHAFGDDVLGSHDGVALAELVRRGEVSSQELLAAAEARAARVDPALNAIAHAAFRQPVQESSKAGAFAGVPLFIKDTEDVAGMPTGYGCTALEPQVATRHSAVTEQMLAQGFVVVGKARLPEFGFSPSTEYEGAAPTRNPWNPAHSAGGSSGGPAALVAAGVVPIAHGNDGGGSIRIPASCNGLVGLKPTRGRLKEGDQAQRLPVKIISDGVLTRSVRDTAHFLAAAEQHYRHPKLPPIGLVAGPSGKRLRIGLVLDSIGGHRSCDETRTVVERVARVLESLGHTVEPMVPPVPEFFIEDFKLYWGLLAFSIERFGKQLVGPLDPERLDGLTKGLSRYFIRRSWRLPLALARLQASSLVYRRNFQHDLVLSPVVGSAVPPIGFFSPQVQFDDLFERILQYIAFTPLNNATGSPAIAVPAGMSHAGVPIGVHFSAPHGDERTLLEIAYQLEAELDVPRIQTPASGKGASAA